MKKVIFTMIFCFVLAFGLYGCSQSKRIVLIGDERDLYFEFISNENYDSIAIKYSLLSDKDTYKNVSSHCIYYPYSVDLEGNRDSYPFKTVFEEDRIRFSISRSDITSYSNVDAFKEIHKIRIYDKNNESTYYEQIINN